MAGRKFSKFTPVVRKIVEIDTTMCTEDEVHRYELPEDTGDGDIVFAVNILFGHEGIRSIYIYKQVPE